jgi:cytochrome P450
MEEHVMNAPEQAPGAAGHRVEIDNSIYNPLLPDFIRDPWPAWNVLVKDYPIAYHKDLHMWVVNTHELCADILKNPKFTPNWNQWEFMPPPDPNAKLTLFDQVMARSLVALPPAEHLRLRKLTLPAFSRKVMQQIDDKIRDLIVDAFDKIGDAGEFDVYTALAEQLPGRSIARMVGVPLEAEDLFHEGLATNQTKATRVNLPEAERLAAKKACEPGFALLQTMIDERRALPDPGDDFLGTLIKTTDDKGDRLDDWDILSLVSALITAGSDTAIDLYTYSVLGLLRHRDQFELLQQRPELMESAIHELLRYGSQGVFGIFRYALEDTELGGQLIRKGQACIVNMSTAWNDPRKYEHPERLDIQRPLEGNIIFGIGPHFCIGTYLVRVQGTLAIQELAKRFPNATLTGEIDYDYNHHLARRINKLIVATNLR